MPSVIPYPVPHYTRGRKRRVNLLIFHTSEGARTIGSLGNFLRAKGTASYHVATDDVSLAEYVDPNNTAWHCRNGNPASEGFCFCGFASWSADEWLRHNVMLENAAWWLSRRAPARGIPLKKLSVAEVREAILNPNYPGGVCMHDTYTRAMQDGSHWDCGQPFYGRPLDWIIERARHLTGGPTHNIPEDDMANVAQKDWDDLVKMVRALWYQVQGPNEQGWELWDGSTEKDSLVDIGRRTQSKVGSRLTLTGRPGGDQDDLFGHVLSTRAELRIAAKKWDEFIARNV